MVSELIIKGDWDYLLLTTHQFEHWVNVGTQLLSILFQLWDFLISFGTILSGWMRGSAWRRREFCNEHRLVVISVVTRFNSAIIIRGIIPDWMWEVTVLTLVHWWSDYIGSLLKRIHGGWGHWSWSGRMLWLIRCYGWSSV